MGTRHLPGLYWIDSAGAGAQTISPGGIPSAEAFGSHVVAGPIISISIPSAENFGTTVISTSAGGGRTRKTRKIKDPRQEVIEQGIKKIPRKELLEDTIKKEIDEYFSLESNYVEYLPSWWTKQELEQRKQLVADLKQRLLNTQAIYDIYSQIVDGLIKKEKIFDSLATNQARIAQLQYLDTIDKIKKRLDAELTKRKIAEMIKKALNNVVQQLIDEMLEKIRQKRKQDEDKILELLAWMLF